MMGYTIEDVEHMKDALLKAKRNVASVEIQQALQGTFDLLDGLIVEGYIEDEED